MQVICYCLLERSLLIGLPNIVDRVTLPIKSENTIYVVQGCWQKIVYAALYVGKAHVKEAHSQPEIFGV